MNRYFLASLCCLPLLGACDAYNDLQNNTPPDTALEAEAPEAFVGDNYVGGPNIFQTGWLSTFNDPKLDAIAKQVLAYNYDIAVAAARVDAAQAAAKKAGAALLPSVDLSLGNRQSGDADGNSTGSLGASLDVSWELDIWGRIRASKDAATNTLVASKADLEYAKQSLVAQATKAYFLAIEAGQQERYAEEIYKNYETSLRAAEAFYREGASSVQDVALAKSSLATATDALEKAKDGKKQAIRSLELLLGKYPSGEFAVPNNLPALPEAVPPGVPSEVLERRPDLIAAERRVAAAFNRTTSAKAARLPRLALTSSIGSSSSALSEIADPTNIFWNVASNLIAPLFDGGARKADVEISTAEQKEAVARYKKAALASFADVENALSTEQTLIKRVAALKEAHEQSKLAEQVANTKYEQGNGQILDVLQIKRSTIAANIERLRAEQELLSERVNLYLALGGGL